MIAQLVGVAASILGTRYLNKASQLKVHVVHASPGRLRLQCDRWKSREMARSLEDEFSRHPLVYQVEASPVTGSLLLKFSVLHITPAQLDNIMQTAVRGTVNTYPKMESTLMRTMKGAVNTVDRTIKTKTAGIADLNSLVILWLVTKGIRGFSTNPTFSFSILLWAFGFLNRGDDRQDA